MRLLHVIAALVAGFEMPVPIYWLVLHAPIRFWRRHVRAGYWSAILLAWGGGDWLLINFRRPLFAWKAHSPGLVLLGAILIAVDFLIFFAAERELGGRRIVGQAELTATGTLATRGLYTRIRHPRYLGMIAGVLGACVLSGSFSLYVIAAIWCVAVGASIVFEERELRARFGAAYVAYARQVPALLPLRFGARRFGS